MKKLSIVKIVAIIWIVFSVIYIGYIQYNYFTSFVAKTSYEKGLSDAVISVINQAQKCEVFPIYAGNKKVNLVNSACVKQGKTDNKKIK